MKFNNIMKFANLVCENFSFNLFGVVLAGERQFQFFLIFLVGVVYTVFQFISLSLLSCTPYKPPQVNGVFLVLIRT